MKRATVGGQPPGRSLEQPRNHTESTDSGWIATAERLPPTATCILIYIADDPDGFQPSVDMAEYLKTGEWSLIGMNGNPMPFKSVSHWMPLPEPPQ